MKGTEIMKSLWDFIMSMAQGIGEVWNWLNEPITFGFKIDWIGLDWSFTLTPMMLTAPVLIGLLILGFIKAFIPVA
jgi:hypothetical protein